MALDESARRARRTYDAAADHFDELGFWARLSERTLERLQLLPGAAVLDAPCGSGASALPAARAVGATGTVVGADLSAGLLRLARAKAERAGLANATFRLADMRSLGYPDGSFDAVVCVLGIFFVDDMRGLAQELWRMVRGGGVLAVTTWGEGALDPPAQAFWDAVGQVRPELVRSFNPWDALVTPDAVVDMLGIDGAEAVAEPGTYAVDGPDGWWSIVLGTGFRGTLDALTPEQRERVEALVRASTAGERAMACPAVFATARKG